MDIVIGLLGVLAAVAIPVYLHVQSHPRRELRYAVVHELPMRLVPGPAHWRLIVWSTGRADIPSTSFDAGRPIVFRFTSPVETVATETHPSQPMLSLATSTEAHVPARLLHKDFARVLVVAVDAAFDVQVENPLIDIPIVRDLKVERATVAAQDRAVSKSRARGHITTLRVAVWVTGTSFVMFVTGLTLSLLNSPIGAGIGIPGLFLGMPVGVILLIIAGLRSLHARRRLRRSATSDRGLTSTS
jgi:hypothetical protein